MRLIVRLVSIMSVLVVVAAISPVFADDLPEPDLAADAQKAVDNPPVIPHKVRADQDGAACNVCHRTGLKDAPPTSHPERMNCTQCHVPSVFDEPVKKGTSKTKKK